MTSVAAIDHPPSEPALAPATRPYPPDNTWHRFFLDLVAHSNSRLRLTPCWLATPAADEPGRAASSSAAAAA
jgi:hypothetical protein